MEDVDDCPGRGKCHGPASWCDRCGDVSLTCDDPACDAHERTEELRQNAAGWAMELNRSASVYLESIRGWAEAEAKAVAAEVARAEGRVKTVPRKPARKRLSDLPQAEPVPTWELRTTYVFADMQGGYSSIYPQGEKMTCGWDYGPLVVKLARWEGK